MTEDKNEISGFTYFDSNATCAHKYLLPAVTSILEGITFPDASRKIFELGCGSGYAASVFTRKGYDVTGVDPSKQGIEQARKSFKELKLEEGSCYDDLAGRYGKYPVVFSLEVVEHVFHPRVYASALYSLLEDGGTAIISTPYHGYWKNLALAVTGSFDRHFTALWDYGHIKFWSIKTLRTLLFEAGFQRVEFIRVGRIRPLAKAMIAVAKKS